MLMGTMVPLRSGCIFSIKKLFHRLKGKENRIKGMFDIDLGDGYRSDTQVKSHQSIN